MYKKINLTYLPVILCTAIALIQLILTITTDLSPWKLGGFGMFSSINQRVLHVTTLHQGKIKTINLKHSELSSKREIITKDYIEGISNYPTEGMLEELKNRLLTSRFIQSNDSFDYIPFDQGVFYSDLQRVHLPASSELQAMKGKALFKNLEIKVFQTTYDKDKQLIGYELLTEKKYEL